RRDSQGQDHLGSRRRAEPARHGGADHHAPPHRLCRLDDRRAHGDGSRSQRAQLAGSDRAVALCCRPPGKELPPHDLRRAERDVAVGGCSSSARRLRPPRRPVRRGAAAMADVKPIASLGATLLARKGGAKPAMRPQVAATALGGAEAAQKLAANLEDLGWNDMGEEDNAPDRSAEVLQLTPAPHNPKAEAKTDEGSPHPMVRSMHEELAARLAREDESDYVVAKDKPKPPVSAPA